MTKSEHIPAVPTPPAPDDRDLALARRWASALGWAAVVLSLWGVFAPDPPLPVIIALAVMPWLAMLMARTEAASGRVGRLRGSLFKVATIPGFALGFIGLAAQGPALHWRIPFVIALIAAAPITVLADAAFRGAPGRVVTSLFVFGSMTIYIYGGLALANARLDTASPERFGTAVLGKRTTPGRGTHWLFRLAPWGPEAESSEVVVSQALYRAVNVGDNVCLDVHPGALGIAWYRVQRCESGE